MLCTVPASGNVTTCALRFIVVDVDLYTSVLPRVLVPGTGGSCVTVTVLLVTPVPAIVTVAVLGLVPVLADVAVHVIVELFDPGVGDTVSQLALSVMLQEVLEVIANVPVDPEAAFRVKEVGDTFKYFAAVKLSKTQVAFDKSDLMKSLAPA